MELKCVSKDEYSNIVKVNKYVYNNVWFHELNKGKVDYIEYMLFKAKKYKMGIIVGVKNGEMRIPYSSPFEVFEQLTNDISLEDIRDALRLIDGYCKFKEIRKIMFRLPPNFYDEHFLGKMQNSLINAGYKVEYCDLNYQFYIHSDEYLKNHMKRNARKNLRTSEAGEYKLYYCNNLDDKKKAYEIIRVNRSEKGYPLRMTWNQVSETIEKIEHDIFILQSGENMVAAAIIFLVTEDIYQVIYWGDIGEYSALRPMNYLAYHLYLYYLEKGIRILDIGPSTEEGIPNYGLCSFKESIGCESSCKMTYTKSIKE